MSFPAQSKEINCLRLKRPSGRASSLLLRKSKILKLIRSFMDGGRISREFSLTTSEIRSLSLPIESGITVSLFLAKFNV